MLTWTTRPWMPQVSFPSRKLHVWVVLRRRSGFLSIRGSYLQGQPSALRGFQLVSLTLEMCQWWTLAPVVVKLIFLLSLLNCSFNKLLLPLNWFPSQESDYEVCSQTDKSNRPSESFLSWSTVMQSTLSKACLESTPVSWEILLEVPVICDSCQACDI